MPTLTTTNDRKTGGLLRRVAGRFVAYAAASVVVGLTLPTIPLPLPLDALMAPAPPVVVARDSRAGLVMSPPDDGAAAFTPTERSRLRRRPQRGRYDEAAVYEVLDAGVMAHIGYVIDGQPFVTPTAYWREGRKLYWHGAAASRMLATVAEGSPVCVTVSFLDGFLVGRSGIIHSLNYRSVMAFGLARLVPETADKRAAMEAFIDRLYAGRSAKLRPMTDDELTRIALVEMEIEEASVKVKDSGVTDMPADANWKAWCGLFPVETRIGAPRPEPGMGIGGNPTPDLAAYAEGARLDEALTLAASPAYRSRRIS